MPGGWMLKLRFDRNITFKRDTCTKIRIIILVYIPFLFQTPAQNYDDKVQQAATYKITEKIKLLNNVNQVNQHVKRATTRGKEK